MSHVVAGLLAFLLNAASIASWIRRINRVAIPRNRVVYVSVWISGLVLAGYALSGTPGWVAGTLAALSIPISLIGLLAFSVSRQSLADDAIQVGSAIPEFSALTHDGKLFDSATLKGKLVLIKFFRGHW